MPSLPILITHRDAKLLKKLSADFKLSGRDVVAFSQGLDACKYIESKPLLAIILGTKLNGVGLSMLLNAVANSTKNSGCQVFVIGKENDPQLQDQIINLANGQFMYPEPSAQELLSLIDAAHDSTKLKEIAEKALSVYDPRLLNVFIESVRYVFSYYSASQPIIGKPSIKTESVVQSPLISSLISITGEGLRGSIALSLERSLLILFRNKLTVRNEINYSDQELYDGAGELGNQVCGAVKIKLARFGFKTLIGLPKVIIGSNYTVLHTAKNPILLLPVICDEKLAFIEFCLERSTDTMPKVETEAEEAAEGGDIILF